MSKVSDAKARQGYRQQGRHCEECTYATIRPSENYQGIKRTCDLGGFAVKARATCDSWIETGSLLAAMQGGGNDAAN